MNVSLLLKNSQVLCSLFLKKSTNEDNYKKTNKEKLQKVVRIIKKMFIYFGKQFNSILKKFE